MKTFALPLLVVLSLAAPAAAQQAVTQSDIQRLQDNVFQAGNDLQQLRGRDSVRAGDMQTELDDLRDEVIYLKVKLRKESSVTRREYADVRDRIEDLRSRARGETARSITPVAPPRSTASTSSTDTRSRRARRDVRAHRAERGLRSGEHHDARRASR